MALPNLFPVPGPERRIGRSRGSMSTPLLLTLAGIAFCAANALAQPVMPKPGAEPQSAARAQAPGDAAATSIPASLAVDTANREEVRLFFQAIHSASEGAPMGWTGNYTSSDPVAAAGTTSAAFKEAVNLRVNFYRALAGVPGTVTFDATFSARAQQAALMMSANNTLQHTGIPTSWQYYTTSGAEAAANSNLALGMSGPAAIDGYIADPGTDNFPVGHRRWVLYPQTRQMGTGDVAGNGAFSPANALWVFDSNLQGPRPFVRESFVAWPAPGYAPYQVVWPRWSISYPNASFSAATVTMTRGGTPVPVQLAPIANGYGENTLVWVYDNRDANSMAPHARPGGDVTYHVTVANVMVGGSPQTFSYDVIVFDPATAGPDTEAVAITGPASAGVGLPSSYTVGGLHYASGFQWRELTSSAYASVVGAEADGDGYTAGTTGSYGVRTSARRASGTWSFHLTHPNPPVTQWLQLAPVFLGGASPQLTFKSLLGLATASQVARVQVSLDEGASWSDVYTQAGSGGGGEADFVARTVALAEMAGRTFHLRFAYTFSDSSYYPGDGTNVGWYFDDIALTGVSAVTAGTTSATRTGNQFTYRPGAEGSFGLQARGIFYGQYPLDWGPVKTLSVTQTQPQAPTISTQPASQTVTAGSNVSLSVVASGVPEPAYQWLKNGAPLDGAITSTLTLLNVQSSAAATYRVVVTNSAGSVTSDPAALTVNPAPAAPLITAQPASVDAAVGANVTFSVTANGHPAPTFQWRRNGLALAGAQGSTLNLTNVQAADAGGYTVAVGNSEGTAISHEAVLTISQPVAITSQPASQSVAAGSAVTISVGASGSNLVYQWYAGVGGDTSAPIAGATGPAYTTPPLTTTTSYWVRVFSPLEARDSATAVISVSGSARTFFGTVGGAQGGAFGFLVRSNNSAVFLAYLAGSATAVDARAVTVSTGGAFNFTAPGGLGTVSGQIDDGNVSGTIGGAIAFSGTLDATNGATAPLAGLYDAVLVDSADGEVHLLAGAAGHAFVLAGSAGTITGTTAALAADGVINATLPGGRMVALAVTGSSARLAGTTSSGGRSLKVVGAREDIVRSRRLGNVSMRGQVRQGDEIMISGFVITGPGRKQVLIRGIGPTLERFAVGNPISDPKVSLFRSSDPEGSPPIATNNDWGSAANAAGIASVGAAVFAFPLEAASADAALLLNLPAGNYTAQIAGAAGQTGAALVEFYDSDVVSGATPTANLANISMRGRAGNGDDVVIAGFVVDGDAPKRLLIRGVASELGQYGVGGLLADPVLKIFRSIDDGQDSEIAANDEWDGGAEQAAVVAASAQVYAFALAPGSHSAALLLWLEAGAYTAQVSSGDGATGIALVEVYDMP